MQCRVFESGVDSSYCLPVPNQERSVANELQKIVPEAIYSLKGKLHPDDTQETDILHYDLTPVVMVHNNAINELVVTLNDLSARVKRLENER